MTKKTDGVELSRNRHKFTIKKIIFSQIIITQIRENTDKQKMVLINQDINSFNLIGNNNIY